jgi:hypothetical protein
MFPHKKITAHHVASVVVGFEKYSDVVAIICVIFVKIDLVQNLLLMDKHKAEVLTL